MKFFEFGKENEKTLMILCGYLAKWSPSILPFIDEAKKYYHVIVQAYDGFNEDEPDTVFESIVLEAGYAAGFIKEKLGGKLDILYGISLGGMVGNELLLIEGIQVHTFIADGYTIIPMPTFRSGITERIYVRCYSAMIHSVLTKHQWLLAKLIGRTEEAVREALYTDVSRQSIVNSVKSEIGYRYKFESFNMTDSYIFHGSAEIKTARKVHKLKKQGINFRHQLFKDTGHAELIHGDPKRLLLYIDKAYRLGVKKEKNNGDQRIRQK